MPTPPSTKDDRVGHIERAREHGEAGGAEQQAEDDQLQVLHAP